MSKHELETALREAEEACRASDAAVRTHGHQSITWELARADYRRRDQLRAAIAAAEGRTA